MGAALVVATLLGSAFALRLAWLQARPEDDPLEALGLCGLLFMAWLGWLTFFGFMFGPWVMALAPAPLLLALRPRPAIPAAGIHPALAGTLALLLAIPLLKSLNPSDMLDWDTLAYHFAVPAWWLRDGKMTYLPFIHQSNFPFLVDNLFALALPLGESAAKIVTTVGLGFGVLTLHGIARRRELSPWVVTLAYVGAPLVLWSSGSGYIDVVHGLFAGLGAWYVAEALEQRRYNSLAVAGALLGSGAASKYTGLQVLLAAFLVLVILGRRDLRGIARPLTLGAAICVVTAAPWYVRNLQNTGNPVYPFFYEHLGGRGWDSWRADIYRDEQQSFGVGRTPTGRDPSALGHATLGLAYQPGRYINPGQTDGHGVPMGALGFVLVLVGMTGGLFVRDRSARAWLGMALVLVGMWFFLSQQVRYMTALAPGLALLAGMLAREGPLKRFMFGAVATQAAYTFFLLWNVQGAGHMAFLISGQSRDEALRRAIPFFTPAQFINSERPEARVALYDEVFGYFLQGPYFWANPGHSTLIPYNRLETGADLARALRDLGLTHAYVSFAHQPPDRYEAFFAPNLSNEQRAALDADLRTKWLRLLSDGLREGAFEVDHAWGQRALRETAGPRQLLLRIAEPR